jgi:hypothetical protein
MAITGIYTFQGRVAPSFGGLFAEPKLLEAYRKYLTSRDKGRHLAIAVLERYIAAEQKLGCINKQIDAKCQLSPDVIVIFPRVCRTLL